MLSPDPAEKGHTEIILTIDCGGGSTQEEPAVAKQASLHDVAQDETDPNSPLLSASSTLSKKQLSNYQDICRICHCEAEPGALLVAPCSCSGSLKYVHQACLQRWVQSSDMRNCELCKYPFVMQTKIKPYKEWEKLNMSAMERRKLACSVTFHAVAFTCVIWSLYVLIDRTAEEYSSGQLLWPFWTKLVVVAIGFTGGVVFMYVQCTTYVSLCRRWRAYNRVILVQDVSVEPVASCGPSTADAAATEATTSSAAGASNHCAGKKNDKKTTTNTPLQSVVTSFMPATLTASSKGGELANDESTPISQ